MDTKAQFVEAAKSFEKNNTVAVLRGHYSAAQKRSGLDARKFRIELRWFANVLDGRCPDGCCGNEETGNWSPTPGEWTALAIALSTKYTSGKADPKKANW